MIRLNSLEVIKELVKDRTKTFKMINYDEVKQEYGNQILGDIIINFSGKICYQIKGLPTVKLSVAFLEYSCWEEIE